MSDLTLCERLRKFAAMSPAGSIFSEAASALEAAEARCAELESKNDAELATVWADRDRFAKALMAICDVDYDTHEALQSTCIDIARSALADGDTEKEPKP